MRQKSALRYVIQCHTWGPAARRSGRRSARLSEHFDVMFEIAGQPLLRTFQFPEAPTPERVLLGISGREIQPHRKEYLTYEGPVSGERGEVHIWDAGRIRSSSEIGSMLQIELASDRGMRHLRWRLHFTGGSDWYLFAANDAAAASYDNIGK